MSTKNIVRSFMTVIIDEIESNPDFAGKISSALGLDNPDGIVEQRKKRRGGRRAPALLDPVTSYSKGESLLREELELLDLEKLRDIVAEYGMDPGKLVMKWKTKQRVIDHIVETAANRAKKGEAFR